MQRSLPDAGHALRTHLEDRPAALVFGSEKSGLSNEQLSHCDWVLHIPTEDDCPSMNLGQAVALCCYEIARVARAVPRLKTPASISAGERDLILKMLMPVLERSGFVLPGQRPSQLLKGPALDRAAAAGSHGCPLPDGNAAANRLEARAEQVEAASGPRGAVFQLLDILSFRPANVISRRFPAASTRSTGTALELGGGDRRMTRVGGDSFRRC